MKQGNQVRHKKRTTKPAVRKQQILRKAAQKRAKYPIRAVRHFSVPVHYYKRSA